MAKSILLSSLLLSAVAAGAISFTAACSEDTSSDGVGGAGGSSGATSTGGASGATNKAGAGGSADTSTLSIKDAVGTFSELSTLKTILDSPQADTVANDLGSPTPGFEFTLFAPSNSAFAATFATPEACVLAFSKNDTTKAALSDILRYHEALGATPSSDITTTATEVPTSLGDNMKLSVVKSGSDVKVNNSAKVTKADIKAVNGYIHIIDKVLIPSTVTPPTPGCELKQ